MTSIVQAPQRGIISASLAHLSRAWKEKNMALLQRIYQRSSINQLIASLAIFLLIYMNFDDGFTTFKIQQIYFNAKDIFFILGITRIIDMGTGVNAQIIATSIRWKFELLSGVILISIMLPLTYILTKEYGVIGPAIGSLVSISIYNFIRIIFLWKKFKLFPFTIQSLYTVLLAAACFIICYFSFENIHGIPGMLLRSLVFLFLYATGTIYMKLSPDIKPVWVSIKKRLGGKNY
jgi:O-antigen/teichoic acid export membrane protein